MIISQLTTSRTARALWIKDISTAEDFLAAAEKYGLEAFPGGYYRFWAKDAPYIRGLGLKGLANLLEGLAKHGYDWKQYLVNGPAEYQPPEREIGLGNHMIVYRKRVFGGAIMAKKSVLGGTVYAAYALIGLADSQEQFEAEAMAYALSDDALRLKMSDAWHEHSVASMDASRDMERFITVTNDETGEVVRWMERSIVSAGEDSTTTEDADV